MWRDFDSLLPDDPGLAPLTVQNASGSRSRKRFRTGIGYGSWLEIRAPKRKVEFWRMERFALPGALAGDLISARRSGNFFKTPKRLKNLYGLPAVHLHAIC